MGDIQLNRKSMKNSINKSILPYKQRVRGSIPCAPTKLYKRFQ
jgi:hypothetical protein